MTVTLDVVVFSYLERPIFDVFIDGKVGDSSGVYPETGGSTVSGVALGLGPKQVSWRLDGPKGTPRNGDTVVAKNPLTLGALPPNTKYLALHIYPDDTAELVPSQYYPQPSKRGEAEISRLEKTHGK